MGKRGDSFARWFVALGKVKKYVVSLCLALITILPATLISSVVVPPLLESDQVTVQCGERETRISREDPIWDEPDPQRAEEMCNRAWGRS
jgi:hypothetical protein